MKTHGPGRDSRNVVESRVRETWGDSTRRNRGDVCTTSFPDVLPNGFQCVESDFLNVGLGLYGRGGGENEDDRVGFYVDS